MPRMYRGEDNQLVAFPMGGIGAGTICLEGTGALSHVSLYHRPDLLHEPNAFAALTIRRPQGNRAVVLQGPVPERKMFRPLPVLPKRLNWRVPIKKNCEKNFRI